MADARIELVGDPAAGGVPGRVNWLTLVIEEDPTRIESTAIALRAADLVVTVVDAQEGRTVLSLLQKLFQGGLVPDVVMVRVSPAGWTTAALLAGLRSPQFSGRVDVVLVTEGTLAMLPVIITDFPGLRLLSPREDISAALADLRTQRAGNAAPGGGADDVSPR